MLTSLGNAALLDKDSSMPFGRRRDVGLPHAVLSEFEDIAIRKACVREGPCVEELADPFDVLEDHERPALVVVDEDIEHGALKQWPLVPDPMYEPEPCNPEFGQDVNSLHMCVSRFACVVLSEVVGIVGRSSLLLAVVNGAIESE